MNPCSVLGVRHDATREEIRRAYQKAVQAYHPDRNHSPNATQHFQKIQWAYQQLSRGYFSENYERKSDSKPLKNPFEDPVFTHTYRSAQSKLPNHPSKQSFYPKEYSKDILSTLELNQFQAWKGGNMSVTLPNHHVETFYFPPEMYDGQTFRMSGYGNWSGNQKGDLIIKIQVVLKPLSIEEKLAFSGVELAPKSSSKSWWNWFF